MSPIKLSIFLIVLILLASCKNENTTNIPSTTSEFINQNDIERIEPPNWWVGFKSDSLQLLVHHSNIGNYTPSINYSSISIKNTTRGNNSSNYLFIDLKVGKNASAGKFNINFKDENGKALIATYELKNREQPAEDYMGFNSSDAIYLITPDRFTNANPNNDSIEGLNETKINRSDNYARHGGDIQGITERTDYIKNLGFTAIWPQPLLTNDMHQGSYHGYAVTDLYEIDPRFGTLEEYLILSKTLKDKGMKLIMDQVANHCGLEHWWMKDLPFKDWVNYQNHYEENINKWSNEIVKRSSHARTTNQDKYASDIDKQSMSDGWFVKDMPDLNQRNPYMANYIIQNSIWWIETAKLGGIRQDTYPYPDKHFMSDWAGRIMDEYPNFNIVGEEWSTNPLLIAYWQDGHKNKDGYDSNLCSTMDFAMQKKIVSSLKNEETWGTGFKEIYEALANDFYYTRPLDILVFPDNHDMSRIFTQLNGDITNTKMALSYLAVLPRTFQMYYGTEILMNDFEKPGDHGLIRTDFPGGWDGDKTNAFTGNNLDAKAKDMQSYVATLMNFRKGSKAIHSGKTKHFAPQDNVCVLVRYSDDETVVHIMNKNDQPFTLNLKSFKELGLDGKTLKNVFNDKKVTWAERLQLNNKGSYLFTTKNN